MKRRKSGKPRRGLGLIAAVVLLLCGIVSYRRIDLDAKCAKKEAQLAELQKQKDQLTKEQSEIEEYKAYVQTKKYIEEVAREKLGLVYEDEIIFDSGED